MKNFAESALRAHVIELLRGGHAHADFDSSVEGLVPEQRGAKPPDAPHTAWQLLEHLRLAQLDILEFSRDGRHKSPKWPEGYWPPSETPADDAAWQSSINRFRSDLASFIAMVEDPANDLLQPIPHAPEGQTLLREALLLADHNSYHLGQLVFLRKLLSAWQ